MGEVLTKDARIKVSSTLDKSVGKSNLTDGNPETCWTSTQGLPQYVQFVFAAPVIPEYISVTFQGGFVGTRCRIEVSNGGGTRPRVEWKVWTEIFPEDVNRAQGFALHPSDAVEGGITGMKLVFEQSSDFFGRITVYDLEVRGQIL